MRPADPRLVDKARALRARGLTLDAIKAKTGLSISALHRFCRNIDMTAVTRAEANRRRYAEARSKWLPKARALAKKGLTRHAIAVKLGVPKSLVYREL